MMGRMSMERHPAGRKRFVTAILPWLIGGGGLLGYLVSLNHWISLRSLDAVDEVSGPVWQPAMTQPLSWSVLSPFRLLPEAAIPLALNLFAAACSATILMWLARTVALLPYNRTGEERARGGRIAAPPNISAWASPVLATLACGLQLTFWEQATAFSGEAIDLLLLAYVIRSLFEFRRDGNERWLMNTAWLYGLGMANNWGFIGFFPVYLAAAVWL
ncbi:MAG: Tetratricopeptide repeat protein, partial [Pedosphaera sp.]|nr:Tetratricopeptide repeat protein [Pedosphaera sp.]